MKFAEYIVFVYRCCSRRNGSKNIIFNKSRLDLVAAPRGPLVFLSGSKNRRFIRGIQRDTGDTHIKKEDLGVGRPDLDRGNIWVVAPNLPV